MAHDNMPMAQKLFLPSLFDLIVMMTFTIIIIGSPEIRSFDVFWHLRTGELLLSGIFPFTDIFSFTAFGNPWILHEWGSQVIFALIYKYTGFPGLIVFRSLIFALIYGLMFKLLLRRNINLFISLVFSLLLVFGTITHLTVRPHIFTNLFLVVLLWIFVEFKDHGNTKILRTMPVLFMVWINLHGGFIVGFIFLAVCIGAETVNRYLKPGNETAVSFSQAKPLVAWTVASFAACFVNPNTYKGVMYPLMYLSGDQMDITILQEWAATTIQTDMNFFVYMVLIILGLVFSKKKPQRYETFLLIIFSFFAFSARRHVPVFSILVTPLVAFLCQDIIISLFNRIQAAAGEFFKKGLNTVSGYFASRTKTFGCMQKNLRHHIFLFITIGLMTALTVTDPSKRAFSLDESRYPIEMADYIKSIDLQGNIFNQYGWGGFLLWALPDKKVFIDGRMDVYKKEITDHYQKIIGLEEGWQDLMNRYAIDHVLVDNKKIIARFLMDVSDDWFLEKKTDTATFFSKK